MGIPLISKRQFNRFSKYLPVPSNAEKIDGRVVLSCAIWVVEGGRSWSDLAEIYGNYDSIRRRFARWSKNGNIRKIFSALSLKAKKRSAAMVDSTTIKAHRTSASLKSDGKAREIGRSAGGLTTKIHFLANIEKIPLDFSLSGGQVHDAKGCEELIHKNISRFKTLLTDKAYDSDKLRSYLRAAGKKICIPPKCNRKHHDDYDRDLYKDRSIIENMFSWIKDWKGIALRCCRSAHMFDSSVCLALMVLFFNVR